MVLMVEDKEVEAVPDNLEEFFDAWPPVCESNLELTSQPHVKMWRDEVLFIKQRQQATSDYRENQRVRWLGSHAAMTCHIAVMRHRVTGVVSLGHFDNFCCWQFGEDSSAHRDGIDIMVHEISFLSCGNCDNIELTVVGGYNDVRGDAAKNSLSLLRSLHDHWCYFYLKHFCVGPYNTMEDEETGCNTAILKGIAIDLKLQEMFPAIYDWGQYDDFKTEIRGKLDKLWSGDKDKDNSSTTTPSEQTPAKITADSTFKPKALRNQANASKLEKIISDQPCDKERIALKSGSQRQQPTNYLNDNDAPFAKVKLKPTFLSIRGRKQSNTGSKNQSTGATKNKRCKKSKKTSEQ